MPTRTRTLAQKQSQNRAKRTALLPAASRAPTLYHDEELDLSADAIETFAKAVGGRQQLLDTLAVGDSGNDKVVNCLLEPSFAKWSLRRICTYAGISVADLFASYKKALFVKAHVQAAHTITTHLPPIVEDVMRRATPSPIACPVCLGAPPPGVVCAACQGQGTVLSEPDLDRQKLALELGHLTERKGSSLVVQQNQIAAAAVSTAPGSLEQLQQAVSDLLFSPGRRRAQSPTAIDAEASRATPGDWDRVDATTGVPRVVEAPVRDPREPAHPRRDPRQLDLPVPPSEPQDPPDDEDEDDEPTRH